MTEQQGPGGTSLSNTVPTVQDVKAFPDEQKKALVQILPKRRRRSPLQRCRTFPLRSKRRSAATP